MTINIQPEKTITIPRWTIDIVKMAVPLVASLMGSVVIILNQFNSVKAASDEQKTKIAEINAATSTLQNRVLTIEIRQDAQMKNINDSLLRIETDVKELKTDIKKLWEKTK
jgi:archaellum component FlaC